MTRYAPVTLSFNSVDPEGCMNEKPPIIFLHGITASKESWNDIPQIVANVTKRKVYNVDSRNHGDSEWSDIFNLDCNVDDLLHFMDSIKAPKAIIVGHSMGGITGIKTALRSPERVEKLVVEDMYVKKVPQAQCDTIVLFLSLAKTALEKVPPGADEVTAKKFIVDFIFKAIPEEFLPKITKRKWSDIELKQTEEGRYSYKANVNVLQKALENVDETMSENTGVFDGPVSFIYGTLSPYLVGNEKRSIQKLFPRAELVEIQNATHGVHSDYPLDFTEALLKFILKE